MKVFISQNIHGLTEEEVIKTRNHAIELLEAKFGHIEIIDNYYHKDVPENTCILWHLGHSSQQLEEADGIYFCKQNEKSNEYKVKFLISHLYNIPILNNNFNDEPSLFNDIMQFFYATKLMKKRYIITTY